VDVTADAGYDIDTLPYLNGAPVDDFPDGTSGNDATKDLALYVNCGPGDVLYPPKKHYRITCYSWGFDMWPFSPLQARLGNLFAHLQEWTSDGAAPLPPQPPVDTTHGLVTFDVFSLGNGKNLDVQTLLGAIQRQGNMVCARCELIPDLQPTPVRVAADAAATAAVAAANPSGLGNTADIKKEAGAFADKIAPVIGATRNVVLALMVIALVLGAVYFLPHNLFRKVGSE
jgi:hypothetical protein